MLFRLDMSFVRKSPGGEIAGALVSTSGMTCNWGESPQEPLTGRNQIAKGNCVTVMWGGEEAGGESQTG